MSNHQDDNNDNNDDNEIKNLNGSLTKMGNDFESSGSSSSYIIEEEIIEYEISNSDDDVPDPTNNMIDEGEGEGEEEEEETLKRSHSGVDTSKEPERINILKNNNSSLVEIDEDDSNNNNNNNNNNDNRNNIDEYQNKPPIGNIKNLSSLAKSENNVINMNTSMTKEQFDSINAITNEKIAQSNPKIGESSEENMSYRTSDDEYNINKISSFRNVYDSMENIKTKLGSTNHINKSLKKIDNDSKYQTSSLKNSVISLEPEKINSSVSKLNKSRLGDQQDNQREDNYNNNDNEVTSREVEEGEDQALGMDTEKENDQVNAEAEIEAEADNERFNRTIQEMLKSIQVMSETQNQLTKTVFSLTDPLKTEAKGTTARTEEEEGGGENGEEDDKSVSTVFDIDEERLITDLVNCVDEKDRTLFQDHFEKLNGVDNDFLNAIFSPYMEQKYNDTMSGNEGNEGNEQLQQQQQQQQAHGSDPTLHSPPTLQEYALMNPKSLSQSLNELAETIHPIEEEEFTEETNSALTDTNDQAMYAPGKGRKDGPENAHAMDPHHGLGQANPNTNEQAQAICI